MAITVTVGRNVRGVPMPTSTWELFRKELKRDLEDVLGNAYFWGEGKGLSEEWGLEDAFTVVLPDAFGHVEQHKVDERVEYLRRFYGQEAAAVTIGHTRFV